MDVAPERPEPSHDYAWFLLGMASMFFLGLLLKFFWIWLSRRERSTNDLEFIEGLPTGNAQLFASGNYSDVRITCGKKTWNLHRSVLCTQSEFFAKACNKVRSRSVDFSTKTLICAQDAKASDIDLSEHDVMVVGAMLYFFYHGDYITRSHTSKTLSATMLHAKLYIIGDKYSIDHLQREALHKLKYEISNSWASDDFADAIAEIYASTTAKVAGRDHELRQVVVEVAKEHAAAFFSNDHQYARFKVVVSSTPEFATDVRNAQPPAYDLISTPKPLFRNPPATLSRYRCPNCGFYFQEALRDDQWYTHCCTGKPGIYAAFGLQWKAHRR